MGKTVRYCIQCGREIGEAKTCDNPECAGIPNFYRDVPGPEHPSRRRIEAPPRHQRVTQTGRSGRTTLAAPGTFPDDRRTIPLQTEPVAMLRAVSPPPAEYLLHPGKTEIGALPPADIIVDRAHVSSRHACIECSPGESGGWEITVIDNDSTNGTFVNGKQVKEQRLAAGDKVRFASVEFELFLLGQDKPRVTLEM